MERSEILTAMGDLKLYGMKAAFDEIIATAVKRQHEPQQIVGDLLTAEISEKQARSIKYQITIAKLPLAKDIGDFTFGGTPINEALVRDLAGGNFLAHQRNVAALVIADDLRLHIGAGEVGRRVHVRTPADHRHRLVACRRDRCIDIAVLVEMRVAEADRQQLFDQHPAQVFLLFGRWLRRRGGVGLRVDDDVAEKAVENSGHGGWRIPVGACSVTAKAPAVMVGRE
jgi:hypothetical protein